MLPAARSPQRLCSSRLDQRQRWSVSLYASIAVDNAGNTAIGYATSSSTAFPGIRYAGRLAGDPLNDLGQGENTMFTGAGSQTDTQGAGAIIA